MIFRRHLVTFEAKPGSGCQEIIRRIVPVEVNYVGNFSRLQGEVDPADFRRLILGQVDFVDADFGCRDVGNVATVGGHVEVLDQFVVACLDLQQLSETKDSV